MDRAQVGIFKETNHVGFARFLDGEDGLRLEPQIRLVLGGDLSDQALEGQLPDEQLGRLLELADLAECNRARSESMWLLDALVRDIGCLPC